MENRRVPNLVVCQTAKSHVLEWWFGENWMGQFLDWLIELSEDGQQPLTVLAHNFQGYDSYPIVDELHWRRYDLEQIPNRGEVLQLVFKDNIRFINSMLLF